MLKLLFCIDYAKTVKQIFFLFLREGKKSFDIINKSAHKSIKKGICKISCFSISDPSSHPIFGYNVKDVLSVIYKKIHGSINYIDYDTRLVTRPRSIHDFVILLGQNIGSRSCDNTRARIYISAKKKIIRILDFYHKLFPWAWMIPLSPHCCCIHVLHTCLLWHSFVMIIQHAWKL